MEHLPFPSRRSGAARTLSCLACCALAAYGQNRTRPEEPRPIQDNSFLLEEAYNQEPGVVQHISMFTRMWNSRDWSYSFTEEWPGRNPRHQFSYTLTGVHAGDFGGSGAGWGDVALNYRYQALGDGDARAAFAPRLSILAPTGNPALGRGYGGVGIQWNAPFSIVVSRRVVTHWNAGGTFVPRAENADRARATVAGFNAGQSVVYAVRPRVNLMLEGTAARFQTVEGPGCAAWASAFYVSPGVRWAHDRKSGLQVVPGIAVPVGFGASAGDVGLIVYLSFEAPARWLYHR